MQLSVRQYDAMQYNVRQYHAVQYSVRQYDAVQSNKGSTMQCSTVQGSRRQYSTWCSAVQHSSVTTVPCTTYSEWSEKQGYPLPDRVYRLLHTPGQPRSDFL